MRRMWSLLGFGAVIKEADSGMEDEPKEGKIWHVMGTPRKPVRPKRSE